VYVFYPFASDTANSILEGSHEAILLRSIPCSLVFFSIAAFLFSCKKEFLAPLFFFLFFFRSLVAFIHLGSRMKNIVVKLLPWFTPPIAFYQKWWAKRWSGHFQPPSTARWRLRIYKISFPLFFYSCCAPALGAAVRLKPAMSPCAWRRFLDHPRRFFIPNYVTFQRGACVTGWRGGVWRARRSSSLFPSSAIQCERVPV